jgi:hypothetical protein
MDLIAFGVNVPSYILLAGAACKLGHQNAGCHGRPVLPLSASVNTILAQSSEKASMVQALLPKMGEKVLEELVGEALTSPAFREKSFFSKL